MDLLVCPDLEQVDLVQGEPSGGLSRAVGAGAFQCVLVQEENSTKAYDLALFTFDTEASAAQVVERHGYHPDDLAARRQAEPWYEAKTEPSFQDMLVKLRKTLIAARFSTVSPGHTDPDLLRDYALACAAAAA